MKSVKFSEGLMYSSDFSFTNCKTGQTISVTVGISDTGEVLHTGGHEITPFTSEMIYRMAEYIKDSFYVTYR